MAAALRAPVFAKSASSGGFTEMPSLQVSSVAVGGKTKVTGGHMVAVRASSLSSPNPAAAVDSRPAMVLELHVCEISEGSGSPAFLYRPDVKRDDLILGDLVAFTNKVYNNESRDKYLGTTSGIGLLIECVNGGYRYEAIFSFYFGKHGHISVQGPYLTYEESHLAVTGGSGAFEGVYGQVKLKKIKEPFSEVSYIFYLRGILNLPEELLCKPTISKL